MERFDLNLVRALVAIYETRSVTRAAERLDLTQPSVSHALARLRQVYGDHLFVRRPHGLEPTALASQLYERFSQTLSAIDETLEAREAFDPASTTRRFRIALSDMAMLVIGGRMLAGLHDAAPRSEIEIVPLDERVPDDLAAGRVDLVIGNLPALGAVTRHELLFRERYVCLVSDEHPGIGEALSLEQFAGASHVVMASPSPGNQLMDAALAEHHLRRRVAIRTPHFAELAQLVRRGRLIAVLPSRLAAIHMAGGGLRALPLPLAVPEFDMRLYWHVRNAGSKALLWLRQSLLELLRDE